TSSTSTTVTGSGFGPKPPGMRPGGPPPEHAEASRKKIRIRDMEASANVGSGTRESQPLFHAADIVPRGTARRRGHGTGDATNRCGGTRTPGGAAVADPPRDGRRAPPAPSPGLPGVRGGDPGRGAPAGDRKSTRLNSSH